MSALPLIAYPLPPMDRPTYLKVFTAYINSELPLNIFIERLPVEARREPNLEARLKWDIRARITALPNPPAKLINTHRMMYDPLIATSTTPTDLTTTSTTSTTSTTPTDLTTTSTDLPTTSALTERIVAWRARQALQDYQSAHRLRKAVDAVVKDHLTCDDPTREFQQLTVKDMRQIAAALRDIQVVQRMALGLSTDNVGIKLDGVDTSGSTLPIVNVLLHTGPDSDPNIIDVTPTDSTDPAESTENGTPAS